MNSYCLTPRYCQLKHCFIELPLQIRKFDLENVALVEWETGEVYLWTSYILLPNNVCQIDINYSYFLRLPRQSNLFVSFPKLTLPICVKLSIIPVNMDDWELLVPESARISRTLLEQQRIVSKNIVTPFWLHSNFCINLCVIDIEPISEYVILQHKTDVCIFQDASHLSISTLPFDYQKFQTMNPLFQDPKEPFDCFLPSQLFSDILLSIGVHISSSFYNSRSSFDKVKSSSTTDLDSFFNPTNFHFQRHCELFLRTSNFTTDGYSLHLDTANIVLPLSYFPAFLNSTCSPVIVLVSLLTRSTDLRSPYLDKLVFNPIVISANSHCSSDCDFLYSFPNSRLHECLGLLVKPNLSSFLEFVKFTLKVSYLAYCSFGEPKIIEAFKIFLSSITEGFQFPIRNNQLFLMHIEGKSTSVVLEFDCSGSDVCSILSCNTFTHMLHINVAVDNDNQQPEILHLPLNTPLSGSIGFFGYHELKIYACNLLSAFFSSLNTLNSILTILVTADVATPKIGRKSFVLYLVSIIKRFNFHIGLDVVDCTSLIGKEFEIIRVSLENLFSNEKNNAVILNNFDVLFQDTVWGHNGEIVPSQIHNYLCSLLFKGNRLSSKLIFIATSKTMHYHHGNSGNQGKHLFHYKLVIPRPTHQDKCEIFQNYANILLEENVSDINCHLLVSEFPNVAHAKYVDIISQSIQYSLLHNSNENIQFILRAHFSQHTHVGDWRLSNKNNICDTVSTTKKVIGMDGIRIPLFRILSLQLDYPRLLSKLPLPNKVAILLYGMPGTGKTLLVESLCLEANFNLIRVRGPEVLDKYIGASEGNIRHVFATARASTPCIVFFDELDSIAQSRGSHLSGVLDRVVNQLLTELDGVQVLEGVFIIATTCHPELIDPALLRPGRIGMHVKCTLPSQKERLNMFESFIKEADIQFLGKCEVESLSKVTIGFSGADIKALISTCKHVESLCKSKVDLTGLNNNALDRFKDIPIPEPSLSSMDREKYALLYGCFEDPKCCRNSKGIKVITI